MLLAFEPIIEATIDFTKLFITIKVTPAFFGFLTYQSFCEYGQEWLFLPFFFVFFFVVYFFAFLNLFRKTVQKLNSFPHMPCVSVNEGTI